MQPILEKSRGRLAELCRALGVRRLAAFGSAVRSDFGPDSDVDLLVEFADTDRPGYADRFLEFAEQAEVILGRPVDLLTTTSLRNPHLKRRVEQEAVVLHAT
jgi:predicted nucleotidyltransferase